MPVRVQADDFDVSAEIERLTAGRHDIGAVATFVGKVRNSSAAAPLAAMMLEHYPGMTEDELTRIANSAVERFRLSAVSVVHRVGQLKPGENIVLVITCSSHRQDAFDGCAYLMDYLKTAAPFWKKELAADGRGSWVDAREADDAALTRWQTKPQ